MAGKRCVCGKSATFPLCDGSHASEGWQCATNSTTVDQVILTSPDLRNLGDRLGHRFQALALHTVRTVVCERLVVICDGQGVEQLRRLIGAISASKTLVCAVGVPVQTIAWAFPNADIIALDDSSLGRLWHTAQEAMANGSVGPTPPLPAPKVFVSHAVADEARLASTIDALRQHFAMNLFVCADSIAPGALWHQTIHTELTERDVFLLFVSKAANASTFCAFEAGVAMALQKPIRMVSLDDQSPPTFLQHLQATSVPRLIRRKPWLDEASALLEACLTALATDSSPSPDSQ